MSSIWFAYPFVFLVVFLLFLSALYYKWYGNKKRALVHSLVSWYKKQKEVFFSYPLYSVRFLRVLSLFSLAFLAGRLQKIDTHAEIDVDCIDFVLCLDVSGSMELFDDLKDRRSRIVVAKQEALHFVDQRKHDPLGLVVFGAEALTLCPLTLDRHLLKNFITNLSIGVVNPNGTKLFTGLATALNRLKSSKAKSKVIVLLTDGKPLGETTFDESMIIAIAQELGVKIYTVGIGNSQGGYVVTMFGNIEALGAESVDYGLLAALARETGGKFFPAHNPQEMKEAYESINKLETTTVKTTAYHLYYEYVDFFVWLCFLGLFLELLFRIFLWKGLFS